MGDMLALSSRIIDSGLDDAPANRVTEQLSELGDDAIAGDSREERSWR